MSRCCEPLSGVVPPHLAAISTNAPTADIVPPSRTTAAGTAIARSVRLPLGNGGSRRVGENSSRRPTPISCRSEEHTSELQSPDHLVCRLLLEKKKKTITQPLIPNSCPAQTNEALPATNRREPRCLRTTP